MNYQEFLEYIRDNLAEYFEQQGTTGMDKVGADQKEGQRGEQEKEEGYLVELHKVIKNNGIILDGITLRKKDEHISPNIYLNSYFESYQMGKPLAVIMEEIIYRYQKAKEENALKVADILDFKAVKSKIVLRLVHYEKNKEQLKCCPYKKYLDLAVTFRYIASKDAMGIASSLITNQEFEAWGIGVEELYQIALFNTMREFPWHMDSLAKVIFECFQAKAFGALPPELAKEAENLGEMENGVNMYVLTNDTGLNGATCILYDNVIKNFAKVQECNIFLLPSSVHEMMLVPDDGSTDAQFLSRLVVEANRNAVGFIDLLSDNIYYYDRERDQVFIHGQN